MTSFMLFKNIILQGFDDILNLAPVTSIITGCSFFSSSLRRIKISNIKSSFYQLLHAFIIQHYTFYWFWVEMICKWNVMYFSSLHITHPLNIFLLIFFSLHIFPVYLSIVIRPIILFFFILLIWCSILLHHVLYVSKSSRLCQLQFSNRIWLNLD